MLRSDNRVLSVPVVLLEADHVGKESPLELAFEHTPVGLSLVQHLEHSGGEVVGDLLSKGLLLEPLNFLSTVHVVSHVSNLLHAADFIIAVCVVNVSD